MDNVQEIWKVIPEFPQYEASNHGQVRSKARRAPCCPMGVQTTRFVRDRVLKQHTSQGYARVKVNLRGIGVHRLVALAFIGPVPDGKVLDHLNGKKLDNRPENLEYVTAVENTRRAHRNGLMNYRHLSGERHPLSKLTEENIREILSSQLNGGELARKFGCTDSVIYRIRHGKIWKHIPRPFVAG